MAEKETLSTTLSTKIMMAIVTLLAFIVVLSGVFSWLDGSPAKSNGPGKAPSRATQANPFG